MKQLKQMIYLKLINYIKVWESPKAAVIYRKDA